MNATLSSFGVLLFHSPSKCHTTQFISKETFDVFGRNDKSALFVTLAWDKGRYIFFLLNTRGIQQKSQFNHITCFHKGTFDFYIQHLECNAFLSVGAVVVFGVSQVIVCQKPCMLRLNPSATDLYMPFPPQRCNFTDRVHFCRQLAGDKERGEGSPPRRHAACFSVLSF